VHATASTTKRDKPTQESIVTIEQNKKQKL